MTSILGLDIGGANLKAAHSNGIARTIAFPLWRQPERLTGELKRLCATMPTYDRLAVTMTGELCDCFATKREGVRAILQGVRDMAGTMSLRIWSLQKRFLDWHEAWDNPLQVAAANWLAQAVFVGQEFSTETVLLIDTGSTTTDLVFLNRGQPEPRGLTDPERLASGELVYTGVRRTPICAVLGTEVAAEFFATMLDAYLVAGLVPENPADRDTADGLPATYSYAWARLARMRCADAETFAVEAARELADLALQTQWRSVQRALERVIENRSAVDRIVVSGSGAILGRTVCARHPRLSGVPLTELADDLGPALSEAVCAYAVAMLATQGNHDEP